MIKKIIGSLVISASFLALTGCETPRGPKYQDVKAYSEGLAPAKKAAGKWGYINDKQVWVIQPRFQDAKEFSGGKAAVQFNGKWGFINKRGEWL